MHLPKEKLQRKNRKRINQMLENGLLNEIKNLKKTNSNTKLSWGKIYRFGFEYKYPAMFLQNKISKDEMIDNMIKKTGAMLSAR